MVYFDGVDLGEEIVPLPIWPPEALQGDLTPLKKAFMSLGLTVKVRPVVAHPGSPEPILALDGAVPDFICLYAPVGIDSPGLPYAIKVCVLHLKDDRIVDNAVPFLERFFGPGVVEIDETS